MSCNWVKSSLTVGEVDGGVVNAFDNGCSVDPGSDVVFGRQGERKGRAQDWTADQRH